MKAISNWNPTKRIDGEFCRTNQERANAALKGLHGYTVAREDRDLEEDIRTDLIDLLADLYHYAASQGIDLEDVIPTARRHFEAER